MLTKTIQYTDFDGKPQTKDVYFNLSKPEWLKLEFADNGEAFTDMVQRLQGEKDNGKLIEIFELLMSRAYGVRDGDRFVKTDEQWQHFMQTPAYEALFWELVTDQDKAMNFMIALLPPEVQSNAAMEMKTLQLQEKQAASSLPPPTGSPDETGS